MTPDPSAETPAVELTKPLRPIAAFALLGANALFLLLSAQRYLLPTDSTSGFTARSGYSFLEFTDFVTAIAFPLLAVLLATHIAPVLAQAKLIVLAALGEYAFAALFGVISFLAALFGGATFRLGVEGFFVRLAHLAVFAIAALVVLRIAQAMQAEPKEDRLSQYGRGGFDPYAAREPQSTPTTYGAEQPYSGGQYSGGGAYGEQPQPAYGQYGEAPSYGEAPQPTTYGGSSEPTTYGSPTPTTYGNEPTTYGSGPTTYGSEPGYGQQYPPQPYPPQPYGTDAGAQYPPGTYAPAPQVYGGAAQPPPAWDPQQPPQPPGGWPAQSSAQPSSGGVYGGEPSWSQQQPGYQDDANSTQLMSPEARRAEEARRAAQQPPNPSEPSWFDQR